MPMPTTFHGRYVDFKIEGGNLIITLTPEGRELVNEAKDDPEKNIQSDRYDYDLLEHQLCNGWEVIRPEECGALTDGMIITNDCARDDDGKLTHLGRVYWHERNALESVATACLERGRCVFLGRD
jgi:hypothetical protein